MVNIFRYVTFFKKLYLCRNNCCCYEWVIRCIISNKVRILYSHPFPTSYHHSIYFQGPFFFPSYFPLFFFFFSSSSFSFILFFCLKLIKKSINLALMELNLCLYCEKRLADDVSILYYNVG